LSFIKLLLIKNWFTVRSVDILKKSFIFLFFFSTVLAQTFFNQVTVDNIRIDGNTISTLNTNGDLTLDFNGTGKLLLNDLNADTVLYLDSSKKVQSESLLSISRGGTGSSSTSANNIFAGPTSGGSAAPGFRTLVENDIPSLGASKITSGTFATSLIGNIPASLTTTGTFSTAVLGNIPPSIITGGTFATSLLGTVPYGNLDLTGSIVNADVATGAAIAYSKLNLANQLVDADISGSAAISRGKVAAGAANHVVINNSGGTLSSEATLAKSRGGTGADNSSVTFPSAGTIAVRHHDTLTAPTINFGTLATPATDIVTLDGQGSTPSSPSSGFYKAYVKDSTKKLTILNSDGLETPVGAGGGGSKNYLGSVNGVDNGGDFETGSVGSWTLGTVGFSSGFPTGTIAFHTGGTMGDLQMVVTNSEPNSGTYSLVYLSTDVSVEGNLLASPPMTLDRSDREGAVLGFSFSYRSTFSAANVDFSGTTSNSFAIAVYDAANPTKWIQPATTFCITKSSGVGHCVGDFQTSADGVEYRLVVYNRNATLGSFALRFDDFNFGPRGPPVFGAPESDWESYSLTIGATTSAPSKGSSPARDEAYWKRDGDSILIRYDFQQSNTGSAGSGTYLFPLPPGVVIDCTKISCTGGALGQTSVGEARVAGGGSSVNGGGPVFPYDSTNLAISSLDQTTGIQFVGSTQNTLGSSTASYSFFTTKIPVVGWSSGVPFSHVGGGREVFFRGNITGNYGNQTSSGGFQPLPTTQTWTIVKDSHGWWDSTNKCFRVNEPGRYKINGSVTMGFDTSGGGTTRVLVAFHNSSLANGSYLYRTQIPHNSGVNLTGASTVEANAGDCLSLGTYQDSGGSVAYNPGADGAEMWMEISKGSASSQIAAQGSEPIIASYNSSATTSIPNSTATLITSGYTKLVDTHGAFNTSTGQFTCPEPATIEISGSVGWGADTAGYRYLIYRKNGSGFSAVTTLSHASLDTFTVGPAMPVTCLAGEVLDVAVQQNSGGAKSLSDAGTGITYQVNFKKVGNY
jgi:hypothetical protein